MQTLTINIHNNALVEKVVWLLEHFKHDGVENISQDDIDDLVQLKKTRDEQSIPFEAYLNNEIGRVLHRQESY